MLPAQTLPSASENWVLLCVPSLAGDSSVLGSSVSGFLCCSWKAPLLQQPSRAGKHQPVMGRK